MESISLFSGAGGMDIGFHKAGFRTVWANDFDAASCETFLANDLGPIVHGDINDHIKSLSKYRDIDLVFGGPPCQGFSVAGKMDPNDLRNNLVWSYVEAIKTVMPRAFVMENVKALATLEKWRLLRQQLLKIFSQLGYSVEMIVVTAADYGVPQNRERMFVIGVRNAYIPSHSTLIKHYKKPSPTVREALKHLGPAGADNNNRLCNAGITLAAKPILRKSPYAGMLFNGAGRPMKIDGYAHTLPASMGGNKTPIVDERVLADATAENWIENYHRHLMAGGEPYDWKAVPGFLRRLTVDEALAIQTFPHDFILKGSKSSWFRMIGNAVPCELAFAVGSLVKDCLQGKAKAKQKQQIPDKFGQLELAQA